MNIGVMIQNFDYDVINAIQRSWRCDFLDLFTIIISYLTSWGLIWAVVGIAMLFFRKTRVTGILLITTLFVTFLIGDVIIKHSVIRPRPFVSNLSIVPLIKPPSGTSFPSTHSCLAAAATTILMVKKRALGFVALALTVFVAFSRLYLCVHYPTDVFCGLLLGAFCAIMVLRVANRTLQKQDRYNKIT